MKAYRFHEWGVGGRLEDIPVPQPGPGQALIRIGGAGACHSDIHIMYEWKPENMPTLRHVSLPFTLGHENAGWIEAGDPGSLRIGSPVVVSPTWSCGHCRSCRQGATNYCERKGGVAGGLGLDGGLAEYMIAPTNCLVPLRSLEPWQAAPLSDAGLTSYHAVKRCLADLTPGTTAVVIGVGGLGHLAVAYLRQLSGARIIAVDRDAKALELARSLGADLCLPSDDTTATQVLDATDDMGAAAVLDFVGIDATLAMASQCARKCGQIVVVGIGGGTLPFRFGMIPNGCRVVFTMGGSTGELAEVVSLVEGGRVKPHIERFTLDEVDEVYKKLKANQISGRAVLVP
jgi:propanol-preferring alcohol dehydrogenase